MNLLNNMQKKMKLDELEICIQLVQLDKPELKNAKYQDLKECIEKEFNTIVDINDIYLLHEPSIEQEQMDMEIYYNSMFNTTLNRGIFN